MKEIQPVNQNILLEFSEEENSITPGGIIIPETAKEKPIMAKVISMSQIDNPEIAVGDTVLFKKYSGTETEIEGIKYLIIPYADVLAKIVETETI
jgi:chaperonin GroES